MSSGNDQPIRIRIEIEIPQGGRPVVVQAPGQPEPPVKTDPFPKKYDVFDIDLPQAGPTPARGTGSGPYVICARGSTDAVHVYAGNVLLTSAAPASDPPEPTGFYQATNPDVGTGAWDFSHVNGKEIPVAQLGVSNRLYVWFETDERSYVVKHVDFTPNAAAATACQGSGPRPVVAAAKLPLPAHLSRWAPMSRTWRFTLHGAADLGCASCTALNGTWAVRFDAAQPDRCRWLSAVLPGSLAVQGPLLWRLQYSPDDGYWYLDCASSAEQAPGAWISYRRHESAWNVHGANTLHLYTDSGLCSVPGQVSLIPI